MQIDRSHGFKFWPILFFSTVILFLTGCGGGGGGDATVTPPQNDTPTQVQVEFRQTVLDHFQDEFVTIQNQGSASSTFGSVAQSDLDEPFSITDDQCSGTTLAPSETCTITVRFSPSTQDTFEDSFNIPSGGGQTMMTVSLGGTSVVYNVSVNQIDRSACPDIRMFVSVTDSNDDPVTSLTQDDFSISENGEPQSIDNFSNTVSPPVSAALVLDSSGSMQPYIADVKAAAKSFIDQLNLNPATDEAAIIKFAASYQIKQDFTDDPDALTLAIEDPYTDSVGETHLYDTVWQAVTLASAPERNDRRAVLVISDGYDEGSVDHDIAEVIENAKENGVPIFTIGLGNTFIPVMQLLADETGGQYFLAPTSNDLQAIYLQIAVILSSNRYVIEYRSPSSGGDNIELDVIIDDGGQLGEDTKSVTGC